jgi:hypothetical protein
MQNASTKERAEPRSIEFIGKTDFVVAMMRIFGRIDHVGSWIDPGRHLVHPDDAELITELLDGDDIAHSTCPEYVQTALYRADGTSVD